jgi:hypothetical protein
MLGCPQCQKHEPLSFFSENSALSSGGGHVALDINGQKANNVDLLIESFDGSATHVSHDFSGWIIGPDSGRVTADS